MLVWLIIILEIVQLVLLLRMRKGGTFVTVQQKHIYVPAPPRKKQRRAQPRPRIEIEEDEEEDYE